MCWKKKELKRLNKNKGNGGILLVRAVDDTLLVQDKG